MPFFKSRQKLPSPRLFSLEPYNVGFSLDRLPPGVDNVRYDVRLSPELIRTSEKMILRLVSSHAEADDIMGFDPKSTWKDERDEFEGHVSDVLLGAVSFAKMRREIQIDYLAQTALVKMFVGQIRKQYELVIESYIKAIRKKELSSTPDVGAVFHLKEQLVQLRSGRPVILRSAGIELFQYLAGLQDKEIREVREINFGTETVIYQDFFTNPLLHVEDAHDDFFMMDEYEILLGRRFDDPDRYITLIEFLKQIFSHLFSIDNHWANEYLASDIHGRDDAIDTYIKEIRNIDQLLNYLDTREVLKALKKRKQPKEKILEIKEKYDRQKRLFRLFYRKFNRSGLIRKIVASYRVQDVARKYCPPLVPQQVALFLTRPSKRRTIIRQIRRSAKFYGRDFPIKPLKRRVKEIDRLSRKKRAEIFLGFLRGVARYHRDYENFKKLKEAMDYVNITSDQKTINLSKANNRLFEFLLPAESVREEKPIINHAIIKADVRGSTTITSQMIERGLNPASYFSLNFFDPITDVLSEYGATKVFIEGDAVILAITEHEETPEGWYSVARACGLASNMLAIVKRYNSYGRKHDLPQLELGIGVTFSKRPPTFLFDEENKIMISPAINQADRLSSCDKNLKKKMGRTPKPFNLYVFQMRQGKTIISHGKDSYTRFNVNGIELSQEAFSKLTHEIELKKFEAVFPDISKEKVTLYAGKFPTATGKFQKLVVREAPILEIVAERSGGGLRSTTKQFYEVVTNPRLIEQVEKLI